MASSSLSAYCKALPKIELHAHIHGSIRPSTLEELLREEARLSNTPVKPLPPNRTMDECFEVFGLIHEVVVSREVLHRIVVEAVEDFARENVKYLELRSTPRELSRSGASRSEYVGVVLNAIQECHERDDLDIQVRLLLSINRNQSVELAEDTVNLALDWRQHCPLVVGIDLSGHSERPDSQFHRFEHALRKARQHGLKLAIHFAEHFDDVEAKQILKFRPDRLGHAVCLPESLYLAMVQRRIPIEVCLTSNVHTLARYRKQCECEYHPEALKLCKCGYLEHPHRRLLQGVLGGQAYPLCLCTDDQGVLLTDLSTEYFRAAEAYSLSRTRLFELARNALDMCFDPNIQNGLLTNFETFKLGYLIAL